jgi:hypothetical protein
MQLLTNILGTKGVESLSSLLDNEALASFIIPKAVVSFLHKSDYGDLSLQHFDSLKKTGYGYSGSIKIREIDYSFEYVTPEQVAAIVSVKLEKTLSPVIKELDLAKLSKTIDLLVKAELKEPKIVPPEDKELVAKPMAPTKPTLPIPPNTTVQKAPPVKKSLVIPEKESKKKCRICGKEQFKDKKFEGCVCVRSLAKSIETKVISKGYKLTFDNSLGDDELLTVFSLF